MAKLNSFEEIIAWQKARELNAEIYRITIDNILFSKDFGLRDQMRRASVSISSNIAEGLKGKLLKSLLGFFRYLGHLRENLDINFTWL
jgi:four helix bundle protein